MKNLVEVNLRQVQEGANYLVHVNVYERYGDRESYLLMGNGKEVIECIKDKIGFDEDVDEDLFTWFEEDNGDGDDVYSIFEV
jgi:hypothetical protein